MPKKTSDGQSLRAHDLQQALRRCGGSARTTELAQMLDVSEETIRRIVKKLEKDGAVERMHGGVRLRDMMAEPESMYARLGDRSAQKSRIAAAAAEECEDGMAVFLDVGSTTVYIAEALLARRRLIVVTNSLAAAQVLARAPENRVMLAGGAYRDELGGAFGADTADFVRRYAYDIAYLSADAIEPVRGFTLRDAEEAQLARAAASAARRVIMAADSAKMQRAAATRSCEPEQVALLVTDAAPAPDLTEALTGWGVDIRIAAQGKTEK